MLFGCRETTTFLKKASKEIQQLPQLRILISPSTGFFTSVTLKRLRNITRENKQRKSNQKGGVEKYYFKVSGAADIDKISVDSFIF